MLRFRKGGLAVWQWFSLLIVRSGLRNDPRHLRFDLSTGHEALGNIDGKMSMLLLMLMYISRK